MYIYTCRSIFSYKFYSLVRFGNNLITCLIMKGFTLLDSPTHGHMFVAVSGLH